MGIRRLSPRSLNTAQRPLVPAALLAFSGGTTNPVTATTHFSTRKPWCGGEQPPGQRQPHRQVLGRCKLAPCCPSLSEMRS